MSEDYTLIVSFPDQSESFVLGFEAGQIWQRMQAGDNDFEMTVHTKNQEVIGRMVQHHKLAALFVGTEYDEWCHLTISKPAPEKLRLIEGGLAK